jgi:hypothetical protein
MEEEQLVYSRKVAEDQGEKEPVGTERVNEKVTRAGRRANREKSAALGSGSEWVCSSKIRSLKRSLVFLEMPVAPSESKSDPSPRVLTVKSKLQRTPMEFWRAQPPA